jgi:hypothetical protein
MFCQFDDADFVNFLRYPDSDLNGRVTTVGYQLISAMEALSDGTSQGVGSELLEDPRLAKCRELAIEFLKLLREPVEVGPA